jgi:hypothetical protein
MGFGSFLVRQSSIAHLCLQKSMTLKCQRIAQNVGYDLSVVFLVANRVALF